MRYVCVLNEAFMKTRTGTALTAVGSNPDFARASGVSINGARTIQYSLSTICGGIGILLYQQSFGLSNFIRPRFYGAHTLAAILIGGASVNKASI